MLEGAILDSVQQKATSVFACEEREGGREGGKGRDYEQEQEPKK